MDSKTIVELIGYAGSVLVLVSMLMTSVIRLRVINLIGSVIFAAYALMIRSYPTAIMNICLALINLYHLRRLLMDHRQYDLIPVDVKDGYMRFLIQHSEADILKWFPEFPVRSASADVAYMVCCDDNPASLFLGKRTGPDGIEVLLDYAMPVYRDTSAGRFLHQHLAGEGFRSLAFRQRAPLHTPYLERIGYVKKAEDDYVFELPDAR